MEDFGSLNLSKKTMRILNNVRLYKKVTYLSDIIHPHEPYILSTYLEDIDDPYSTSTLLWPYVVTPTQDDFKLWAKYIQSLYTLTPSLRLRQQPSRMWLPANQRSRRWAANIGIIEGQPKYLRTDTNFHIISNVHRRHLIVSSTDTPAHSDEVPAINERIIKWDNTTTLFFTLHLDESTCPCELMVTDGSMKYGRG